MEFKHMEIKEFNKRYNMSIKEDWHYNGDFYEELNDQLESNKKVDYYYTSMDKKDVIEDIEETKWLKDHMELIEIENVYLAILV